MKVLPERIESKIEPIPFSGCWVWIGSGRDRYGSINFQGKTQPAHRVVWKILNGEIPAGMELLHSCDIGFCVNPGHLRIGTHKENMADMVRRGRQRTISGESHWTKLQIEKARKIARKNIRNAHGAGEKNNNSKITMQMAEKIRAEYKSNPSQTMTQLGSKFGIGREQTRKVIRGYVWKF